METANDRLGVDQDKAALSFPGGTAVSHLRVYDSESPDGAHGGSAHMHLLCTEGYVVVGGTGSVQTLGSEGFKETSLQPSDVVWFTPGTIHRLVNEGDLHLLVVMQNAGLPEAGDAVLTFPLQVLLDPTAYADAASLESPHTANKEAAAHTRKNLAVEGFLELKERVEAEGSSAFDEFYAAACRLVAPRLPDFHRRISEGPGAVARITNDRLADLQRGDYGYLRGATTLARKPIADDRLGMCGTLTVYDLSGSVSK